MAGSCNIVSMNNEGNCLLFFNEIFPESLTMNYQKITRVITNFTNDDTIEVDDNYSSRYERLNKENYAHLSVIDMPWNYVNSNNLLITYINEANETPLSAYKFNISKQYSWFGFYYYYTNISDISTTNSKNSRTGYSGAYNPNTGKYRFVWTEE